MPELVVRPCQRRDLPAVCAIEEASFPDPYPMDFFEWLLARMGSGFLVACESGIVLGYVVCGVVGAGKGHLISIATLPGSRRTGVGTRLMESVIGQLGEKGVSVVRLEVRQSNTAAISFYAGLSFVESGRKKRYYPDGEDAVVMMKRLGPGMD